MNFLYSISRLSKVIVFFIIYMSIVSKYTNIKKKKNATINDSHRVMHKQFTIGCSSDFKNQRGSRAKPSLYQYTFVQQNEQISDALLSVRMHVGTYRDIQTDRQTYALEIICTLRLCNNNCAFWLLRENTCKAPDTRSRNRLQKLVP